MLHINVENISSDSRIASSPIKRLTRRILRDFNEKGEVNIIFVPDKYMRGLNRRYTRRKGSTDVLAFSFAEEKPVKGEQNFSGEVYISAEKARIQSKSYQVTFEEELKRLVTHGILHLLGYDHKSKKDREEMRKIEEKYIFTKGK
ncbi:MAG: rRNA maturation RNase YbeY [candidate division Zixibacteria bacterium]|nr:rRNA maturation RNase YbeY [candidate division Zixibacteria bacterium]